MFLFFESSDELDALYDRFLLRKEVLPVSDSGLMNLLAMTAPGGGGGGGPSIATGLDEVSAALSVVEIFFKFFGPQKSAA